MRNLLNVSVKKMLAVMHWSSSGYAGTQIIWIYMFTWFSISWTTLTFCYFLAFKPWFYSKWTMHVIIWKRAWAFTGLNAMHGMWHLRKYVQGVNFITCEPWNGSPLRDHFMNNVVCTLMGYPREHMDANCKYLIGCKFPIYEF